MTFNPIEAWLHMKEQLPPLPIERIGLLYVYPAFLVLLLIEYFNAKQLYSLRESFASFVILVGATLMRIFTNVFEITIYLFLFYLAAPLRESLFGYTTLGFAWYVWIICMLADAVSYTHLTLPTSDLV